MIYTTCKYAPEELFAGFGVTAERLDPAPVSFSCADGCAHPNLCGFAKAVIEEVHAKNIRELILTDCCDAMRRTYDVLLAQNLDFLWFLPLPHKTGEAEIRLFAGELRRLAEAYEAYSGIAFSWEKAWETCRSRLGDRPKSADGQPELSLQGAHGGSRLRRQLEEQFPGWLVRDDTCTGNRYFTGFEQEPEDFFPRYARLLLKGLPPCMRTQEERRREPDAESVRGVVYHTIKFCDYYSFEYMDRKNTGDLPILKIETDTTPQSSGQLSTRIGAFAESLGAAESHPGRTQKGDTMFVAGIDSGSTSTDAVILNREKQILGKAILPTGMSASRSAQQALDVALQEAGLSRQELSEVISTGYGRENLGIGDRTVTEITCHAKGANFLFPGVRTIIDIGGQDSKVIRVDEDGHVLNFIMNDKCAAGTGRFLEMQARALGLSMEEMSRAGLNWKKEVQISNMCTVFAESEVVSLVAQDTAIADIVHGLNRSVAAKTISLVRRGKGEPAYAMTGGVSRNVGVVRCLEEALGEKIRVSEESQLCGAIGAALLALESR